MIIWVSLHKFGKTKAREAQCHASREAPKSEQDKLIGIYRIKGIELVLGKAVDEDMFRGLLPERPGWEVPWIRPVE
jgi:hypothetical protein